MPSALGFPHVFGISIADHVFFAPQRQTKNDPWLVFSASSAPLREAFFFSCRGAEDTEKKRASWVVGSLCA